MHPAAGIYSDGHGSFVTAVLKNALPSSPIATSPIGSVEQTATDPTNGVEPKELKFNPVTELSSVKMV